jgi:hypothetical protein
VTGEGRRGGLGLVENLRFSGSEAGPPAG